MELLVAFQVLSVGWTGESEPSSYALTSSRRLLCTLPISTILTMAANKLRQSSCIRGTTQPVKEQAVSL